MGTELGDIRSQIVAFCDRIGEDALLVQGAGGNVSWKEQGALWIKASGAWIAEAAAKDIFVAVDLMYLQQSIQNDDFLVTPRQLHFSSMKPSIETLLHALMPQTVVVHLHVVEALSHLVQVDAEERLRKLLGPQREFAVIDYFRPGADLARSVGQALLRQPDVDLVFLKNHGVLIGGPDVASIEEKLQFLRTRLEIIHPSLHAGTPVKSEDMPSAYHAIDDVEMHQMATRPDLYARLSSQWVLFPDHVVFLGSSPAMFADWSALKKVYPDQDTMPELVFIAGQGVFIRDGFNKAKHAQLRCYLDVLVRLQPEDVPVSLSAAEIGELLNWDAERYRQAVNTKS